MLKLYIPTICLGLLLSFSACSRSSSQTGTPVAQQSPPEDPLPGRDGWDPAKACAHLSDKLKTGSYINEGGNIFGCRSTAKGLGAGSPPNSIVYYVKGDPLRARQVGLVVSVNNLESANDAHRTLLEYSEALSLKALGVPLSPSAGRAISSGGTGKGRVDTTKVEVLRNNFSNGGSYELHFVITPRL
jgi:hypothetical protein